MKEWSGMWKASTDPSKQRKYRINAPVHVRRHFLSVHLSPELRKGVGTRAVTIRKGDSVRIMRGDSAGLDGEVTRVDYGRCKVYVNSTKIKKVDGSEVQTAMEPSKLMITKLSASDKRRQLMLDRKQKTAPAAKKEKPAAKAEKKKRARPKHRKVIRKRHLAAKMRRRSKTAPVVKK
jgi:large subunit ribosomal protein L24